MIGIAFLLLVGIGIYLLLRSHYENLSIGKYIGYSASVGVVAVIVMWVALSIGRAPVARGFPYAQVNTDIQIVELNADDLDPEVQDALLAAIHRTIRRRTLSTEELLDLFEKKETPQEGVCGVCYDTLDTDELLGCPECHKTAHKRCLKEWIESGQSVCIYCRHEVHC